MGAFLLSTEVINIAILFSQVKVQSAVQSETFLISGIPKEYDDLTESVQLEWFLQDIDSDETVQVHLNASTVVRNNLHMMQLKTSTTVLRVTKTTRAMNFVFAQNVEVLCMSVKWIFVKTVLHGN